MQIRWLVFAFALLFGSPAFAANPTIEVWKSTTCECCGNWVKHLEANGFTVKVNPASPSMLDHLRKEAGIGDKLASCHTAKINGYVIEGHVPASDIQRLVAEKPDAIGLTVPGMVAGSPGMSKVQNMTITKCFLSKRTAPQKCSQTTELRGRG